ncbi:LOW QUALITY PROTEIN: F-box protein At3g58530 [Argentina anserina]|uniref:LOW QUALITY PROTEIN: F-box protein At3g58530 n=1 Tax=Argentina anserina TaxID=57926 RepID=UPI00217627B6|nr:LOW QUALITY PROTEIN: F-box protein At3g58530 [Potentilla anserina]
MAKQTELGKCFVRWFRSGVYSVSFPSFTNLNITTSSTPKSEQLHNLVYSHQDWVDIDIKSDYTIILNYYPCASITGSGRKSTKYKVSAETPKWIQFVSKIRMEVEAGDELSWSRETVPKVMKIVSTRLPQRDLISLLLVSPWLNATLISHPSPWLLLDFREMNDAGNLLISALSLPRYRHVTQINLEFAQDIEDKHLEIIKNKCFDALQNLSFEVLNLNSCQKISDKGVQDMTGACANLKNFSIYWNVRVTDIGITHLVKNCKYIIDLNISGCKNLSDKSLQLVAQTYPDLESLNLTRCVKLTDSGLQQVLNCSSLQSLNLYALSSFTDAAYMRIYLLAQLKFLDLCGAQNLSDEGLSCIVRCNDLLFLSLTWCVRITDVGVIAIAESCTSLEYLSLFGIVGVTDACLVSLSRTFSNTMTTLDVNGCIGIKRRSRDELLKSDIHSS